MGQLVLEPRPHLWKRGYVSWGHAPRIVAEGALMPSGPAHLHERFGDDWTAWLYLRRRGFTADKGVVSPPWRGHTVTEGESDAIDYLFMEWDWAYLPDRAPEKPPERSRLLRWRAWLSRVSSGPLRVRDKYLGRWHMWWYCVAKYELRRRWYYATGRRKLWDEGGDPVEFNGANQ